MTSLTWYFDFVSPFSYLQSVRLGELPQGVDLAFRPVLFAALLEHWGTLGPAELPTKRRFTYRYVQWYAQRHGIPLRMPPAHPFNPLRLLRLALALGAEREAVLRIFRFVWAEGRLADDESEWRELTAELGASDADGRIAAPGIKDALRRNTAEAIALGVFGVPTFHVDGHLFWGVDATDMLLDHLRDPGLLDTSEMRRVGDLSVAAARRAPPPDSGPA